MGGHGGLNILPQKRWNVYNFDNREKVRRDEEEAAKEEQLKREQSRKRDAEFRLERLRTAKGLAPLIQPRESEPNSDSKPESEPEHVDAGHINLFEGIKIFDPIRVPKRERDDEREEMKKMKKMKKEGEGSVRAVGPEDEKYRLGYGVAGKGVELPWYVQKQKRNDGDDDEDDDDDVVDGENSGGRKSEKKKKTLEELREERLKRERREKERERALRQQKQQRNGDFYGSGRFTRR